VSLDIIAAPSPNVSDRKGTPVSLVVMHYTGMKTGAEALERLREPAAGVSAHYLVDTDGTTYRLVEEAQRAHHAGLGGWGEIDDVNSASIGIEIVNPGHFWGYTSFPKAQMRSVIRLTADIFSRHGLRAHQTVGHSDIAPERKEDPGEKFPWDRMAREGLAIGPYRGRTARDLSGYERSISLLQEIGYRVTPTHPVAATLAFQRRFCPREMGQGLSPLTRSAIVAIAERYRAAKA
jgi:N-acetylmuramoyl-L-alanine amidase